MKKNVRMLALTLVVAIALVGAGYAAWGTRITTTTALNSGEWNIVLENDSSSSYWAGDLISDFTKVGERVPVDGIDGAIGADEYSDNWEENIDTTTNGFDEDTGTVDPATAHDYVYTLSPKPEIPGGIEGAADAKITSCTFGFYNLHPGTKAYTRFEIRNDGSIPAKIGDVKVEILDENGDAFESGAIPGNVQEVIDEMVVNPVFNIHHGQGGDTSIAIGSTNLSDLQATLKSKLLNVELLPDTELFSYTVNSSVSDELDTGDDYNLKNSFNFELPGGSLTGNKGMNAKFQVKISLDFVQYNEVVAAN